jgi:hypothetical protein
MKLGWGTLFALYSVPVAGACHSAVDPAASTATATSRVMEIAIEPVPEEDSATTSESPKMPDYDIVHDGVPRKACVPVENWENCVGKVTRLWGKKATLVSKHPSRTELGWAAPAPGVAYVEDHLDVDGKQVVVELQRPLGDSSRPVKIVGRLEKVQHGLYSGFRLSSAKLGHMPEP